MTDKNINYLHIDNFNLIIPELPIVSEVATGVLIPSISLNPAEIENRWVKYPAPGEKINYSELEVEFNIDENLDAYVEVFNWMVTMAGSHSIPVESRREVFSDVTVQILNNNKLPIRKIIFRDVWPTTLGAIQMNVSQHTPAPGLLTLAYTDLYFDPKDNNLTGYTRHQNNTDTANY